MAAPPLEKHKLASMEWWRGSWKFCRRTNCTPYSSTSLRATNSSQHLSTALAVQSLPRFWAVCRWAGNSRVHHVVIVFQPGDTLCLLAGPTPTATRMFGENCLKEFHSIASSIIISKRDVRKIPDCFIEFWPKRYRLKVGNLYMRFRIQINFRWCLRIFKCHRLFFLCFFFGHISQCFSFRLASNWQLSWPTWGTYLWNQIDSQQAIYIYFSQPHNHIYLSAIPMESVSDNWFRRTDSRLIFIISELNAVAKSTICPAQ